MQVSCYISMVQQTGYAYYGITGDRTGLSRSTPLVNRCSGFPPTLPGSSQLCVWNTLGNAKETGEQATVSISLPRKDQDTATQRCSGAWDKDGPQEAHGADL